MNKQLQREIYTRFDAAFHGELLPPATLLNQLSDRKILAIRRNIEAELCREPRNQFLQVLQEVIANKLDGTEELVGDLRNLTHISMFCSFEQENLLRTLARKSQYHPTALGIDRLLPELQNDILQLLEERFSLKNLKVDLKNKTVRSISFSSGKMYIWFDL